MKRKNSSIKKSVVTELITELAKLPEREKTPDDSVSLSEFFSAKEYMREIKGALKRGYGFDDLAKIFSERCGFVITSRQMKYHFTRGQNRRAKSKPEKKSGGNRAVENDVSSADSQRKNAADSVKEKITAANAETVSPLEIAEFDFENDSTIRVATVADKSANRDAISPNVKTEESLKMF
jgi:hypothetical protein